MAKRVKKVKAWGCLYKGKLCAWAESKREFARQYTEDVHECKIIPVEIIPVPPKKARRK